MRLPVAFAVLAALTSCASCQSSPAKQSDPPPPATNRPVDDKTGAIDATAYQEFDRLFPKQSGPTTAVAVADVTGDGRNDVLATTAALPGNPSRLVVWARKADGFEGAAEYPLAKAGGEAPTTTSFAVADLNHDGRADVVLATSAGLAVLLQNAQGKLGDLKFFGAPSTSVVAGDFNHDGRTDVVALPTGLSLQTADGTFGDAKPLDLAGGTATSLRTGDFNGDGLDDVALFGSFPGGRIALLLQSGGGLGAAQVQDGGEADPRQVGDVNGDGRTDLVVSGGGSPPDAFVGVRLQQKDGGFAAPVRYATSYYPNRAGVADSDGDGRLDLFVQHEGWGTVGVYRQRDDGSLAGETIFTFGESVYGGDQRIAVGDVTGDGRADVVGIADSGVNVLLSAAPAK